MADTYAVAPIKRVNAALVHDYATGLVVARVAPMPRTDVAPARIHHFAVAVRDYSAITQGGGGGGAERPLVGLLHPPGRRGNRAPATV